MDRFSFLDRFAWLAIPLWVFIIYSLCGLFDAWCKS